jgi:hypothetical protein
MVRPLGLTERSLPELANRSHFTTASMDAEETLFDAAAVLAAENQEK